VLPQEVDGAAFPAEVTAVAPKESRNGRDVRLGVVAGVLLEKPVDGDVEVLVDVFGRVDGDRWPVLAPTGQREVNARITLGESELAFERGGKQTGQVAKPPPMFRPAQEAVFEVVEAQPDATDRNSVASEELPAVDRASLEQRSIVVLQEHLSVGVVTVEPERELAGARRQRSLESWALEGCQLSLQPVGVTLGLDRVEEIRCKGDRIELRGHSFD